jgi:hypothetical protein
VIRLATAARSGIGLAATALVACFATGRAAYDAMSPEQQHFASEVLARFTPDTTPDEISAVLGPPYRQTPGKLYWRRPGAGDTERVDVYFLNDRIFMVRYMGSSPIWVWELKAEGDRLVASE